MEHKYCYKCKRILPDKASWNRKYCEICKKKIKNELMRSSYRSKKKADQGFKERRREQYQDNKDKIKERSKEYYSNNKEKIAKKAHEKYLNNTDKLLKYHKEYRSKNKEAIRQRRKIYEQKAKDNLELKIRRRVRNSVYCALLRNGFEKGGSILSKLSYSIQELRSHLESMFESWMNWENWGVYDPDTWNDNDSDTWTWQIDHIIPQSSLIYNSMDHPNFEKCWALDNLRPYSAKLNLQENNRK